MKTFTRSLWPLLLFATGIFVNFSATNPVAGVALEKTPSRTYPGDSVQSILRSLSRRSPDMVGYIPETGRWYLLTPRADAVPEPLMFRLQDAFYYDIGAICRFYGMKYLADWRTLAAKASRETFWGTSYLANRAHNYFGIRLQNKQWACTAFRFCTTIVRNDPEPSEFIEFANFESSLWMFIHTIYSYHYLERLPDQGAKVEGAIEYERRTGLHYYEPSFYTIIYATQIPGYPYTDEELIYTWSEHPINNLCADCTRQSDRDWIYKVWLAETRAK